MDALIKWLSSGSVSASIILVLMSFILAIVALIYLVAFLQGREISFWPPKIGEKRKESSNKSTDSAVNLDSEKLDTILRMVNGLYSMTENILQFHILDKIYKEFGAKLDLTEWGDIRPEEGQPDDKDTPFVLFFTVDKQRVKPGDVMNVLFRGVDNGNNFQPKDPNAVEIADLSTMTMFPSRYVGRGYHFAQIHFSENAAIGYHKISFTLRDSAKNSFTQSFKVLVEEDQQEK